MNRKLTFQLITIVLTILPSTVFAQEGKVIELWKGKPLSNKTMDDTEIKFYDSLNIMRIRKVSIPTLEMYKPEHPNGTAIIVCPGGGYYHLSYDLEGRWMKDWMNSIGVTMFILKYRIPNDETMEHKELAPLADAQRAIYLIRKNAEEYGVDKNKIGIMGFSAGGHLASTLSTHFEQSIIPNEESISLRPDFSILMYPVISMKKGITHLGSRINLLEKNPSDELIDKFSNDLHITPNTPPTFLSHADDDNAVPIENSLNYYLQLHKNRVPASLHIFEKGGHGFSMRDKRLAKQWTFLISEWLAVNNFIPPDN